MLKLDLEEVAMALERSILQLSLNECDWSGLGRRKFRRLDCQGRLGRCVVVVSIIGNRLGSKRELGMKRKVEIK